MRSRIAISNAQPASRSSPALATFDTACLQRALGIPAEPDEGLVVPGALIGEHLPMSALAVFAVFIVPKETFEHYMWVPVVLIVIMIVALVLTARTHDGRAALIRAARGYRAPRSFNELQDHESPEEIGKDLAKLDHEGKGYR